MIAVIEHLISAFSLVRDRVKIILTTQVMGLSYYHEVTTTSNQVIRYYLVSSPLTMTNARRAHPKTFFSFFFSNLAYICSHNNLKLRILKHFAF